MKKKNSQSGKWFSDVQLNWDAVNSFISDVKVKDNIPAVKAAAAVARKTKAVIAEKSKPQREKIAGALEKVFVDRKKSSNTDSLPKTKNEPVAPARNKLKEELIDVVEELDSCAKARRGSGIVPIARVHCLDDGSGATYWFTNRLHHPREISDLYKFGNFVPRYSDLAIKMQKSKVGISFPHYKFDNIGGGKTHIIQLENQSDLQNQTISIAGDDLMYQYRNIQEFLHALRQNIEDINDVKSRIKELEEQKKENKTPQEKAQITNSIKKCQEEYRILTQQQEDLKNITIYIRKQGEMRYSLIVDPIQTAIMSQNLFDGKTVVIKGGPGTGKTTTMIHRLAYLTDTFAIEEDERNKLNNYKISSIQKKQLIKAIKEQRDWMFFSPSQMLKDYLADAMKKEGLANTAEKVWNWKDYCRMVLQDYYHLLEKKDSNAPFKVCYKTDELFYHDSNIIEVFNKFYLDQLRGIKSQLPKIKTEGPVYAWTSIAQNIEKRFEDVDNYGLAQFVSLFNSLESVYGNDCKRLLSDKNNAIVDLADKICNQLSQKAKESLEEIFELASEEISDSDVAEDEFDESKENVDSRKLAGKIQQRIKSLLQNKPFDYELSNKIQKWLKSYCYSTISDEKELTDEESLIAEVLVPIIEGQFDAKIKKIGELMEFEQYAQYTRGTRAIMLNGMPIRYKRFRTFLNKSKFEGCDQKLLRDIMQSKQGKELHHQEQSLLLGFINTLVKLIQASTSEKLKHDYIEAYEQVARPIIGIDEATDFSTCDIYAMQSLLTRDFSSLTLCGDMMQRMTSYGIKSWDELNGVVVNPTIVEMKTSYRQSKKLLEVARQLYIDTIEETPSYRAFMKSNKVPAPLVYIDENELNKIDWISKRITEVYRAYGEQLPSIAIFVTDKGYIPRFLERLQDTEFFKEKEIKVLDGTTETSIPESHICVYPIDMVKGMEFDVVFFHNIDASNLDVDLLKRYIYVGVSRAAFFLGITMNEDRKDISKYFEKNKDWFKI